VSILWTAFSPLRITRCGTGEARTALRATPVCSYPIFSLLQIAVRRTAPMSVIRKGFCGLVARIALSRAVRKSMKDGSRESSPHLSFPILGRRGVAAARGGSVRFDSAKRLFAGRKEQLRISDAHITCGCSFVCNSRVNQPTCTRKQTDCFSFSGLFGGFTEMCTVRQVDLPNGSADQSQRGNAVPQGVLHL
jgi:hypothetical protein